MITAFQVHTYLNYWLDSVDSHSLHSPFFFDFYTKVVRARTNADDYKVQETLRGKLMENELELAISDPGAGSQALKRSSRRVKDIARVSLSEPRFSSLYERMIAYFKCANVVELGTSLGINTLYLAAGTGTRVTTFEGAPEIAEIARDTFSFAGSGNIQLIEGDIDRTLPEFLMKTRKVDFAFMDANHRYEPTISYFRQLASRTHPASVIVIDDIHYNPGMEKAWNEIMRHPLVYGSADLYRAGVLFFDPSLNKQHVVLQF